MNLLFSFSLALWDFLANKDNIGTLLTRKTLQDVIGLKADVVENLTSIQKETSNIFGVMETITDLFQSDTFSNADTNVPDSISNNDNLPDLLSNSDNLSDSSFNIDKLSDNFEDEYYSGLSLSSTKNNQYGDKSPKPIEPLFGLMPNLKDSLNDFKTIETVFDQIFNPFKRNVVSESTQSKQNKPIEFCASNQLQCDYLQCLSDNFATSRFSSNLKMAQNVIMDVSLRQAIYNNPQLLQMACSTSGLTDFECFSFKNFIGLVNFFDPAEAHMDDEPRDKRSVKDSEMNKNATDTANTLTSNDQMMNNRSSSDYDDYSNYYNTKDTNNTNDDLSQQQPKNCNLILESKKSDMNDP